MTESHTSENQGNQEESNSTLEVLERLDISKEAADEIADEWSDEDVGVVRDHTYDGAFYLVRWHDE